MDLVSIVSGTYDNATGFVTLTTNAPCDAGGASVVGTTFGVTPPGVISPAFAAFSAKGVNYKVISGTYDTATGLVTLTLDLPPTFSSGIRFRTIAAIGRHIAIDNLGLIQQIKIGQRLDRREIHSAACFATDLSPHEPSSNL